MRHPIDDIFNKGIGQQKHEFSQEEWMKAKALLDLEKRKKRILIWWFGAAAGILLGAIVLFSYPINPSTDANTTIAESQDMEQGKAERNIAELTAVNPSEIKTGFQTENSKKEKTESHIKVTKKVRSNENLTGESLSQSGALKINNRVPINTLESGLSEMENAVESKEGTTSITTNSNPNSSSTLQNAQPLPILESIKKELNLSGDNIEVTNRVRVLSIDTKSLLSIAYLYQEIAPLEIESTLPRIDNSPLTLIHTTEGIKLNPWSFGMYASYTVPQSKPSLGVLINRNITGRWTASIGAGVVYHKYVSYNVAAELSLIDANGITQSAQLSEDVMFRQVTLEVPINIGYHIGKHSILALGSAEINLWSELIQDAIVNSSNRQEIDLAGPALDFSDPVTVTQQSKTINAPSLSKPKYYLGLGYGLEVSKRLSFQTQGLWNTSSSQEDVESAFAANQSNTFTTPRWYLRTSLIFRF